MADRKDDRAGSTAERAGSAATPSALLVEPPRERPATCISADELAALIAGDVAPERVEAILVHVDGIDPDDPGKAFLRKTQGERLATIDKWIAKHR